jgi:hypothetical protein
VQELPFLKGVARAFKYLNPGALARIEHDGPVTRVTPGKDFGKTETVPVE